MLNTLINILCCIAEPLVLFTILRASCGISRRNVPWAYCGAAVIAAISFVMSALSAGAVVMAGAAGALFVLYAALFGEGDRKKCALYGATVFIALKVLMLVASAPVDVLIKLRLIDKQNTEFARIISLAVYIALAVALTTLFCTVLSKSKKPNGRGYAVQIGTVAVCVTGAVSLYLLFLQAAVLIELKQSTSLLGIIAVMVTGLLILILILFDIIDRIRQRYADIQTTNALLSRETEHNAELAGLVKTMREIKHDCVNHMSVISMLTRSGNIKALRQYMEDYNVEYGSAANTVSTGNAAFDAIVTSKLMLAENDGIRVTVSAMLEPLTISDTELASLIGNLLDNAITACRKLNTELSEITLLIRPKADMLRILVKNTSDGMYRFGANGELLTTKAMDGHGLGLSRVKSIVNKHAGVMRVTPDTDFFLVDILLPIANESICAEENTI